MFLKHCPWMSSIDITWEFVRNPKSAPHTNPMEAESENEAQKSVVMSLTGVSDLLQSLKITDIKSKREIFMHGVQHATQQNFQVRLTYLLAGFLFIFI